MSIFADPVVSLGNVFVQRFSLTALDMEISIRVENPNPVGANLIECPFTILLLNNGNNRMVATGNTGSANIRPKDSTVVQIPVQTHNAALAQAIATLVIGGKIELTIEGTAVIRFLLTSRNIPFSRTLPVTRDQVAGIITGQKTTEV